MPSSYIYVHLLMCLLVSAFIVWLGPVVKKDPDMFDYSVFSLSNDLLMCFEHMTIVSSLS